MKQSELHGNTGSGLHQAQEQRWSVLQPDQKDLFQILEAVPDAYLILSPDLEIQLVTDAYLAATLSNREDLLGKNIFDAFPDNPATPEANPIRNLHASLNCVLDTRKPDQMVFQQYDVPRPDNLGGGFEEKYWSTVNTPVLNEAGEVAFIIHKITDVTNLVKRQEKQEKRPHQQHHMLQAALDQLHNTQQRLEAEQRRLQETQTMGHIGSFEAAFPYGNIRWSDELFRIHGFEPQREAITFEKYATLLHPDDKAGYEKALEIFYREQNELDHTCRIIRKDGATRVLHLKGEIIWDAQDTPTAVFGTVQDITERVQAQQKISERESLLREAEQVGNVGSYYGDIASLTFRFSEGMFHLLGFEPDAFVPTLDMIDAASHPDDALAVRQILQQAARDKQPYEYERRIYRPDGEMRYMHSTGKVKCDSEGNAVTFVGIVQDVTERKQAEEKVRQSELHFRTLIDNTPDVITRWSKDLELVFNNQTFETRTGASVSSLYQVVACETDELASTELSFREKVALVFETGETQDCYNSFALHQDVAYYHSRIVPEFAKDGTVQSVLVIGRDISALKKLEQENLDLKLTQQKNLLLAIMETQEKERRRIAEALHNGIGQLLYGAKLNLDQLTREEVIQDVLKLKASVLKTDQMLEQAINQVRSISHELTPSVLEHFGLEAAFKQITATLNTEELDFQCLTFNLQSELEKHLQVSVYRIAQELANNIVKHAQATEASLLLREQKKSLVLMAEDNGKGFDLGQVQAKGIGLKSIQERVKLLNGTMRIHSAPDQGTLIYIILPLTG